MPPTSGASGGETVQNANFQYNVSSGSVGAIGQPQIATTQTNQVVNQMPQMVNQMPQQVATTQANQISGQIQAGGQIMGMAQMGQLGQIGTSSALGANPLQLQQSLQATQQSFATQLPTSQFYSTGVMW